MDGNISLSQIEVDLIFKEADPLTRVKILEDANVYTIRFARNLFKEELSELVDFDPTFSDWILLYSVLYNPTPENIIRFLSKENADYIRFLKKLKIDHVKDFFSIINRSKLKIIIHIGETQNRVLWKNITGLIKCQNGISLIKNYVLYNGFDVSLFQNMLRIYYEVNKNPNSKNIYSLFEFILMKNNLSTLETFLEESLEFSISKYIGKNPQTSSRYFIELKTELRNVLIDLLILKRRIVIGILTGIYSNATLKHEDNEENYTTYFYRFEEAVNVSKIPLEMLLDCAYDFLASGNSLSFRAFIRATKSKFPEVKIGNKFFGYHFQKLEVASGINRMISENFSLEDDFDFSKLNFIGRHQEYVEEVISNFFL